MKLQVKLYFNTNITIGMDSVLYTLSYWVVKGLLGNCFC